MQVLEHLLNNMQGHAFGLGQQHVRIMIAYGVCVCVRVCCGIDDCVIV